MESLCKHGVYWPNFFAFECNWTYSKVLFVISTRSFPHSFILCRMLLMSFVSETKNKFDPIPTDIRCAKKAIEFLANICMRIVVSKNPSGFFQSKRNLQNLRKSNKVCIVYAMSYHIGIGNSNASLPMSVVK